MCRWDRHESDDYTRDHFHAPPTAGHDDGENRDYPDDPFEIVSDVVLPWVDRRIGDVWAAVD